MQRQAVPLSQSERCIVGTGNTEKAFLLQEGPNNIFSSNRETFRRRSNLSSEDAVLISERLVYEDINTDLNIQIYSIQTNVTSQGPERITKPLIEDHLLRYLERNGAAWDLRYKELRLE
uniref:DNA-directed RNA polymerase n=1 Tax=Musa acuminata subsp. malaccensis TaxID=214687 RepID=A0A804U5S8_MUSAM